MRILIVGAGGIGGYFGGRMLDAGRDITFLVRPRRAALLAERGLTVKSPIGDLFFSAPPTITADRIAGPFDMILLSCKAYDLESAIADIAPAVGPGTAIVPMLNGMRHLDALDARFGAEQVMGGQCAIAATLDADGTVRHLNPMASLGFGERDGTLSSRAKAIEAQLQGCKFDTSASETVMLDMWEKWCMLATIAGMSCLMRAPLGDIVAGGGADLTLQMFAENCGVAERAGQTLRPAYLARVKGMLTQPGSLFAASMMRDILAGGDVEADHVIGDLLERGKPVAMPMLHTAYVHLKTYQAKRAREAKAA
jgi:2-dehydropantoate 2-reductase